MIKISVVIPSYNQEQFLSEAIESVYNQTLAPHEILVIDDGSTDKSLEIARGYEYKEFPAIESPVRVISQVNKGLATARNTGIMNATGDYVLFLDSDDKLTENAIERITQIAEQTNADIIAPSFKCFGIQNNEIILTPSQNLNFKQFASANYLGYFCAVKRSKLLEVGGYSPRMLWGYEDYHLTINLLARGASLITLQEVLVHYRTRENSMIHIAQQHHNELIGQIAKDFPQLYA